MSALPTGCEVETAATKTQDCKPPVDTAAVGAILRDQAKDALQMIQSQTTFYPADSGIEMCVMPRWAYNLVIAQLKVQSLQ